MTIAADLRAVLALLTTLGWRRGQERYTRPGPLCLHGAAWEVTGGGYRYYDAVTVIARLIGTQHLVDWNDASGRDWEQVRAVLRRAIVVAGRRAA